MTAPQSYDPLTWGGFGDFTVTSALSPDDKAAVNGWLEAEHFLGDFKPIGHSLIQIILDDGNPVAVIQWAACAYHLKDREAWIGWSALTCAKRRNLVVNNVRFLVLEAARRPNLASKSLAHAVRALPAQWLGHFGYEPLLCETFTDIESHAGTCYKAAGWTPLGLTEGHRRQRAEFYVPNDRPKKLWIKPLRPDAQTRLCAPVLDPVHAAGETSGKGAPLPVTAAQLQPLAQVLNAVPDPRGKSRQHRIGPLLCLVALGILCGGTNLNAILRHARRLTQAQLRSLGVLGRRHRPGSKIWIYRVPDYETFRKLLRDLDLDAFGRILSGWLGAHRGALPAALALDGKTVRQKLGTIVTLCDVEQKMPVAVAATTAPGGEQACARTLLRSAEVSLLNATVSLDALYTNNENAGIIVQEKGGDYLISLKDNQPTILPYVENQLAGAPLFANAPENRNGTVIGRAVACVPLVSESAGLAHVGQAARITRTVTHKKTGEVKTGSRLFLSSIPWEPGRAASLAIGSLVRRHWVVENNIHWLRDGVWKEDTSRSRCPKAACALALLRTALLAPIRARGHTSLTTALEFFAENKARAVDLIRNQRLA